MRILYLLGFVLILALPAAGAAQAEGRPETLRVFLDCHGPCDFDYIRREIPWVSYVRDRTDAHVHVLVTVQGTGGGGMQLSYEFIGRPPFEAQRFDLKDATLATDVWDEIRQRFVRTLKLGLAPFAAKTALADRLDVRLLGEVGAAGGRDEPQLREVDPWNYWVFNVRGSGGFSGESSRESFSFDGRFSANRTTPLWKNSFNLRGDLRRSSLTYFEVDETNPDSLVAVEIIDERYTYSSDAQSVRAVAERWSMGGRAAASAQSRLNQDFTFAVGPALEFSVFPYDESDRRRLTITYSPGVRYVDYADTTLFDKLHETLAGHALTVAFEATQPWGGAQVEFDGSQYFHDLTKYSLEVNGGFDFRIFRGLSFNTFGAFEWIRDQLFLPKGGDSIEDVLLQRRQLATNYAYRLNFGLSYRFGSAYNNVVNPRLGGGNFF